MLTRLPDLRLSLVLLLALAGTVLPVTARAASCTTQSQMTPSQRDVMSGASRAIVGEMQRGDVQGLRANTLPAIAADFSGISESVGRLKPLVQQATLTVDSLYLLDASTEAPGAARTDFYCGTPVVVLNVSDLPPGTYALAIVHATGVQQPQQVSLILSLTADHRWLLAGFFIKPMLTAGHDGLWYWMSARKYTQKNMKWDAWLYYRIAADTLNPVDFLTSPNLEKLREETDRVKPDGLPGTAPLMIGGRGAVFKVTRIDNTTELGALDLDVHYVPDDAQAAQLQSPPAARQQVTQVMTALLSLYPELHDAFRGIWVHADRGSAALFSLELPMDQIASVTLPAATGSSTVTR